MNETMKRISKQIGYCVTFVIISMAVSLQVAFTESRTSSNDAELDSLFEKLLNSETMSSADKITGQIWKIWINDAGSDLNRSIMERGVALMSRGKLGEADELFSELIIKAPEYVEAWNKRATVRFMMGQLDMSLKDVDVVLSKEPKHFGAVSGLGLILMQAGDLEGALQAYKRVLQINPFSRDALHLVPMLEQSLLGENI